MSADFPQGPIIGPAADGHLHVMTQNLRYPAPDPGHLWEQRRPVMAALLDRERPCVLGTQEGHLNQIRDIAADLPGGYEWIGEGREGGGRGEHMAIFYDSRHLAPREHGHVWLSDTPHVPGSTTWGNAAPRMATWVRFADTRSAGTSTSTSAGTASGARTRTETGMAAEFVVVNTHLDNHSATARIRGATFLARMVESFGATPVIVTGDFNTAAESSEPYRVLVADTELSDTWLAAKDQRTPAYATFAGYKEPAVGGVRIDWILTTAGITVEAAAINPFAAGGQFPSDHLGVQALLTLPHR
ncbi:endonuclease/exonuclease/phosphatase family protein [Phytoactinopolyspora halophila]|uniref:endonuclease/exonuclease/phosphatase family protein n=1 Tax=Phytoactinopolyspora halophila TaxID=1981511 RepID=UPI001B8B41B3|nr:endonuclease/exonuclease/phosphatase family protein [Phytoactinopolyspora halophila]